MFNINTFVKEGLKNTLLFRNNAGTSHNGPWKQVYPNTVLDRFHVGDFASVEYTISADYNSDLKEILKVLVTATVDTASVVVYARNSTSFELIDIDAEVNNSYVDVIVNPVNADDSTPFAGVKVIYTAQYFHTQNPPTV
jgi:hypothetical protein